MASILLHISAKQLNDHMNNLTAIMGTLKGIYQRYENLNENVKTFMGETDDNFEAMRDNVRENIKIVAKAYNIAKANQKQLQDELTSLEGLQSSVGQTLQTGVETVRKVVETINVASDIDI